MARVKGSPHKVELSGLQFSNLFVVDRLAGSMWNCICSCGNKTVVSTYQLKSHNTKSCGCFSRNRSFKHGMEGSHTYNSWAAMFGRCNNPQNKQYKNYGARGISVCDEWKDFRAFFADMGEKLEGMTLDRIDNNGNYCKANCRWVSQKEQIRNRRVSPKFEGKSLAELAEQYGIHWRRAYERVRAGWDMQKALNTPVAPRKVAK